MPATEKTWRDQAKMHVIFGVSALVMLAGTIWMLAKDHNREWRRWQLDDRAREHWTIEAQLAQAQADSTAELERLNKALETARSTKVDGELVTRFAELAAEEDARLAKAGVKEAPSDLAPLEAARTQLEAAEEGSKEAAAARQKLLDVMDSYVREAKRRENALVTKKKFVAADQTAVVSARGIAIGEGKPTQEIEARIQELAAEIVELDARVASAKDYRMALEDVVRDIQAEELDIEKQVSAIEAEHIRLKENLGKYSTAPGEWINRAPVVDALYTGNIKLDQIWLPDMTINYNFSSVARYDRCIVCHRAIDKTAAGSATEPAYPAIPRGERERSVQLGTPPEAPKIAAKIESDEDAAKAMASVYGIVLADRGQVDPSAVTIQVVAPTSLAAVAGLQTGDIILQINGGDVTVPSDVKHYLLDIVDWGKPLDLKIRRGLDQPFTSHPRLDLFVGSTSPHKMGEMGCTICHDGQGSATDFKWASHTPNDPQQALDWSRAHGWFDNHHWIFPMTPLRFIESNCLKCHHEVVELEPSERFPKPPAPKLVQGYHLVREYGCFGCHEITGWDGPTKRVGPDLRLEPNFSEVAKQALTDPGLSDAERESATSLVGHVDAADARNELLQSIRADAALAAKPQAKDAEATQPRLKPATHALVDSLKDVDTPGQFRKVGPSLRHLDSKVGYDWVYAWIRQPSDFRPTTRMPQFFLQHDHLDSKNKVFPIHDAAGKEVMMTDADFTARFENIEIRALSEFLLKNSQPFEYIGPPQGITESPSAERGKMLFETRGCLACHSHVEFPDIHSTQGPDLSRVSAKFKSEKGQQWLYSWVKAPNHYYPRTAMPNVFLDPIAETDASGNPTGQVTDPAADVMEYLLSVPTDWKPEAPVPPQQLSSDELQALNDLTTVWLSASFPRKRAEVMARDGIDDRLGPTLKVDERVLLGKFQNENDRAQRQLEYVARRSLSRYGCFGCHDIPGYETAKPIGTPLASWGRKDPAQLAFENIGQFLATHGVSERGSGLDAHAAKHAGHEQHESAGVGSTDETTVEAVNEHEGESHGHLDPLSPEYDLDTAYFLQSLIGHQRHGFLWQKLRQPRSFDYETTRTKRYDERLRMPKFPFNEAESEAVMTFILGLTNEAPAARYIYNPPPRQQAIVDGRHVLHKYNCAGCHILDMDRWDVAFEADRFEDPPSTNDFPFLRPQLTAEQIKASLTPDRRGFLHAELHGMTTRDESTGAPRIVDEDGVPIEPDDTESERFFEFTPYRHAVVAGQPRLVGVQNLMIPAARDGSGPARGTAFPGLGGDLAKYLYPRVIAQERTANPNVVATEAWGWLPPPLHDEGEKVQTDWLHDFLMDPTRIRPAAVLRMPNFHMTGDEASKLVDYFAAKSNAEFPYEYNVRRRGGYLAEIESAHPAVLDDAMRIVTNGNYCVKCHSMGDYQVRGAVKTLGPNLDEVYRRLRPEFTRRWIANPQRILPYTGMPVNIPYDPTPPTFGGVAQDLFKGPSTSQVDGVVDLLMNFDEYTKRRTSVKGLVKEPPPAGAPVGQPPPNNRSAQR